MTLLYFLVWKIPFNRLIWYSYFLSLYIYYSHAFCFCNIYLFGKKAHNEISKIIFSIVSKHPSTFFHDLKNILKWNLLIFNFFPFEMLMTMSHIIFYKSDKNRFQLIIQTYFVHVSVLLRYQFFSDLPGINYWILDYISDVI